MTSNTSNNEAFLYIQTQSASAQSGVTGALTDNNGVRLKLHGDDGIFSIETGSSERLRIDSSGRSLFKTNGSQTSPLSDNNVPVQIAESSSSMCYFGANKGNSYGALFGYHTSYGGVVIRNVNSDDITFYTNSTQEKVRITSAGKVGIGTTNPLQMLEVIGLSLIHI